MDFTWMKSHFNPFVKNKRRISHLDKVYAHKGWGQAKWRRYQGWSGGIGWPDIRQCPAE
jgi:hypothetical protein